MFSSNEVILGGSVSPGFEPVRDMFESNLRRGSEHNCQLCVYARGRRVVDLWGSAAGDDGYGPDTLQCVFSSGKSLSAACAAVLVGRGRLDYRERVSTYWPEFGKGGKEDITVADVMRHEAGLVSLARTLRWEDMFRKE